MPAFLSGGDYLEQIVVLNPDAIRYKRRAVIAVCDAMMHTEQDQDVEFVRR